MNELEGRGRGRSILILGPDGAGKSALAMALVERLGGLDRTAHIHLRAHVLPRRTASGVPVTAPHARPPYGRIVSVAKTAWLYLDLQTTWRILVPRLQRRGRDVVIERGWSDVIVDPRRFRLRASRLASWLAPSFPAPDLEIVLTADAAVLVARKPELPVNEVARQVTAWRTARPAAARVLQLDAARPLDELLDVVMGHSVLAGASADEIVAPVGGPSSAQWVSLPPARPARWHVPRSPRAAARAGLAVYQPVTVKASAGWKLARGFAAIGGFRLLPGRPRPEAIEAIASVAPPDSTFAVANGRGPGRATVLVMDPNGRPVAVAKIATDPTWRTRLHREAAIGTELRAALTAPLSSPSLIASGDAFLLFEAVDWVHRQRSWELPDEVAAAMGRLFRAGVVPGSERGYTHGDFAPWNVLRTADGWSLVDWADARVDGPPFYDVLHYLVQAHALLGRPTADELVAAIGGRGRFAHPIAAYAEAAGLDPLDVVVHLPEYLDTSERGLQPGPDRWLGEAARAALRTETGLPAS